MTRPSLELAVRDPGFTPSVRDVDALVDLLADDELVKHVERAIGRVGADAVAPLQRRFARAVPPLRARVLRAIGRFVGDQGARALLLSGLEDSDAKTRRNAVIALGHVRAPGVEEALLRAWDMDPRPDMRRSLAAALGKVGTRRSLAVLKSVLQDVPGDTQRDASRFADAELARIADRAILMIERTESREHRGRLDPARVPERPVEVVAFSRRGLEELLADELTTARGASAIGHAGPGRVRALLAGPMEALFAARTMLSFRFPLPTVSAADGEALEEAVARAATGAEAQRIFSTWTEGAVRYRIAWVEGGHRRAATWAIAGAIARRAPAFVNDPTASLWEVMVTTVGRSVEVALAPRALDDPRFTWRRGDVPAASHPTIAAALARVAGVRADDVVWDPFVGSAAELVERGLAGPFASLEGSDMDELALATARENVRAAGVSARLERADALVHAPAGVTLVITNPPMGRRASRVTGLADQLDGFVEHVAGVLSPGGRLVWIAPWPERTRRVAARAGLALDWARLLDMGGFEAEMQRWAKPG